MDMFSCVLGSVASYKKPVGIDAIWRTGHKRTVILPLFNLDIIQLMRKHNPYLIHFIGQSFSKGFNQKGISPLQLINIRKQLRAGQTPVPGNHTMGGGTAYRKRRAFNMADRYLQYRFIRSMIDRKRHLDLRNFHIGHDSGTSHIQYPGIRFLILIAHRIAVAFFQQAAVIGIRLRPETLKLLGVNIVYLLHISGNRPALMEAVPVIRDSRIQ